MYPNLVSNVRQLMQDYMTMTATVLRIGHHSTESNYEIELHPNLATASLIPQIEISFSQPITLIEMIRTAMDLITDLTTTALKDYMDFQIETKYDELDRSLTIIFKNYNIRT